MSKAHLPNRDKQRGPVVEKHLEEPPRRGFLAGLMTVLAGLPLLLSPLAAGLTMFFDPLLRRGGKSQSFVRIGNVDAVPQDGAPVLFSVVDERTDAWTKLPKQAIGALYVRRNKEGKLMALSAECPHLGCFVPFNGKEFSCPCHASTFAVDGVRVNPAACASPRDMDPLVIDEAKLASGEIWVEFKRFRAGQAQRVEKT